MTSTAARLATSVALASGLALVTASGVAAQKPAHPHAVAHAPTAGKPSGVDPDRAKNLSRFRGVAQKLGTTPEALEAAYVAARKDNPNLTHGQFIAANVVAHNLSAKNPNITAQAILDGLKSGKSIGQTLHGLGLSAKDARDAEQAATHEADEAEKTAG